MKIRRFYSKNMRTALRQVSEEFGDDAAIISSQKTASGVEVIAALDYDEELLPSSFNEVKIHSDNSTSELSMNQTTSLTQDPPLSAIQPVQKKSNYIAKEDGQYQTNHAAPATEQQIIVPLAENNQMIPETKQAAKKLEWTTDPGLVGMREELGLMRTMMSEQLKSIGWERFSEKDPTRAMLSRKFSALGIDQSITNDLIPQVKKQQDAECCWQNLLALLAKSIAINTQDLLTEGGIFAFMGPTGAGKTTTIAKLAARFVIKHGVNSVAVISTDNYRISAQQQLGSFAKLLGIPMLCVSKKHPLENLLNQIRDKKLVLIDTAGMSNKDLDIASQLQSLKQCSAEIKRFLLIPATNQLAVIRRSIELFKAYSPYAVIITKLDEAASLGEVLSQVIENGLPVAFTTDGQRVPEDIRAARNHNLVSKAVWLTSKYGSDIQDWQLAQELQQLRYG